MPLSFLIFDDFLSDPIAFRDHCKKMDYPLPTGTHYYPGCNSAQRVAIPDIDRLVSTLVHEPVQSLPMNDPSNHHGKCRLTLDGETGVDNVHVDNCHWSGILYLNTPEQCQGGTDFFRHKATGRDTAPLTLAEMQNAGFKDAQDVWDNLIAKDTNNPDAWEKTMSVPMRFNRLILLRPYFWHAPSPGFGSNIEDGRLVYLMFFKSTDPRLS